MIPVILVCGTRKIDQKKAYFLVRDALDKIIIEKNWITKPDLVVAFPGPESVGTWDMIRRAEKAGVEVIIIEAK